MLFYLTFQEMVGWQHHSAKFEQPLSMQQQAILHAFTGLYLIFIRCWCRNCDTILSDIGIAGFIIVTQLIDWVVHFIWFAVGMYGNSCLPFPVLCSCINAKHLNLEHQWCEWCKLISQFLLVSFFMIHWQKLWPVLDVNDFNLWYYV